MNDKFEEARGKIIDQNSESQTLFGMSPTVRRLMSVMYYNEKPMTLDEMTELLGMSKASMSNAVRELDEMGLVEKVWRKGERKDLYRVEMDNYESFFKYFGYHWRKVIGPKKVALRKSIDELNALKAHGETDRETLEQIDKDLSKLEDGLEYYDWLGRLIDAFDTHEIFDFIPKRPISEKAAEK
ncbi:GbsR/MarR family transcriptional regulator [Indiicoccus explosivorum]|uniref:GbsR/MarR family transcriptional regulator n=1 Tax=Indiicoccus explosivorum TaxID=1917864 RepID=UPI000B44B4A3|nr:MarR family transcriptional regulator [Indiicoccus explosivorum]